MKKVIGYLRVSTVDQDVDKFRHDVLKFANDRNFGKVSFVEEKISGMKPWRKRKLKDVVDSLDKGDRLVVPELSRLGRSLVEVLEVLNILKDKDVSVFSVKENFQLNGADLQSKMMRTMLALFAEIERDLISARTKEGLAAAKAQGKQLGRPRTGKGKSRLDEFKTEIESMIKNGVMKTFIAKKYKVSPATLHNWLRKTGLDKMEAVP
jgi:DNA invertase Pin-like site-specific DNA recombinase